MTWCSKFYGMFNVWEEPDDELTTSANPNLKQLSKIDRIHPSLYHHEVEVPANPSIVQYDDPFLETNDSLTNDQLYNTDYTNGDEYRGEHIYTDTFFPSHQRDEQGHLKPKHRPYTIATISNMSLNLPTYRSNTDENCQQQISRSYSLEFPMEVKRKSFILPSLDNVSSDVRYSANQLINRQDEKKNRLSLNLHTMTNSQVSLPNREDSFSGRISTRSTYSTLDYENHESQSHNNEQIQQAVQYHVKHMLTSSPSGVFPMIFRLPSNETLYSNDRYRLEGGYGEPSQWIFKTKILPTDCRIASDNIASMYTNYFFDQYHYDIYAIDDEFNPVVMSIKPHNDDLTVIVRTKQGSKCMSFYDNGTNITNYITLSQRLFPNLQIDHFENCSNFKAQQFVKTYDEKLETQKFKFGIIYQRRGQTTEEEFFNNERHSRTFDEFLDIIATRVSLKNFKGYRGGLDVSEQTDSPISYYECYEDKEIMFHVSTLLPFTPNDITQIQRKRHIGNDIVTIVFQEENTPFHPSMIKSNFLHVFLVIQPVQILSRTCYKMMLVARDDVEEFPPILHPNVVYVRTAENLKPLILSKLINAEYAAYRCRTFSLLQERTRCSYLKNLCESLSDKSYEVLCDEQKRVSHRRSSLLSNSTRKRYLSSMKKIFTRHNSTSDSPRLSIKSEEKKTKTSKKLLRLGKSMDSADMHPRLTATSSLPGQNVIHETHLTNRYVNGRSDESLQSSGETNGSALQHYPSLPTQVYYGDESDEGLDSMSSVDTTRAPYDSDDQDAYRKQLREKSQPSHIWRRVSSNQRHIYTPRTAGIHISEEATV